MLLKQLTLMALLRTSGGLTAFAQSVAFTYQGRLTTDGLPANAAFDLRFRLFDAPIAGSQIGPIRSNANVAVSNGLLQR